MSDGQPTPRQLAVLRILSEAAMLTVPEIHARVAAGTTIRATRQLLERLATRGWVARLPWQAEQGDVLHPRWRLLPAGATAANLPLPPPLPQAPPARRAAPNPAEQEVLALLAEFAWLTTEEIHRFVLQARSRRTLQRVLAACRTQGWLQMQSVEPALGIRAPRQWSLTQVGARAGRLSVPTPMPILRTRAHARPQLRQGEALVLHLLAYWKALRTRQIAGYLFADKAPGYTPRLLARMAARRLIAGQRWVPHMVTSEHYWQLRPGGAAALQLPFAKQYRRPPAPFSLDWRGQQLAAIQAVYWAGGRVYYPGDDHRAQQGKPAPPPPSMPASAAHPRSTLPKLTAYEYVVEAVVFLEEARLAALSATGRAPETYREQRDRLAQRQLGALVPIKLKDYVAYRPGRLAGTAILILHPPYAGAGFWNRGNPSTRRGSRRRADSRCAAYSRLARILPVFALFAQYETLLRYEPMLVAAGLRPILVEDLEGALGSVFADTPAVP